MEAGTDIVALFRKQSWPHDALHIVRPTECIGLMSAQAFQPDAIPMSCQAGKPHLLSCRRHTSFIRWTVSAS